MPSMKVCIVGASGKLGRYMVRLALERGYEVVGVCREHSVSKLEAFKGRMAVMPGATARDRSSCRAGAGHVQAYQTMNRVQMISMAANIA